MNERARRRQRQRTIFSDSVAFTQSKQQADWMQRPPESKRQHSELSVNSANDNGAYYHGDIDLSADQAAAIASQMDAEDASSQPQRQRRKVGATPLFNRWTKMPISYDFDPGVDTVTRAKIRQAIKLWETNTCVRWLEDGPDTDRLQFYNGPGCSSMVGRVGGKQQISIAVPGCEYVGIISHEIGHSLGFFHEQARPDADQHIDVVAPFYNIVQSRYNNFLPVKENEVNYYNQAYDYGSVMHYDAYGFAVDPSLPTIRTTDAAYQSTIGQRITPSFVDFAQINAAYCTDTCISLANAPLTCQHGGYADPNACSQCKCPSGFGGKVCDQVGGGVEACQWSQVAFTDCGGVLQVYSTPNYIQSKYFPDNFKIGDECAWLLRADPGKKISLAFEQPFAFSCKDSCDESHVEIKRGGDWRPTGFRVCCRQPTDTFVSVGNEMIVIFRAIDGPPAQGFRARVWSDGAPSAPGAFGNSTVMPVTVQTPPSTTSTSPAITTTITNRPGCSCSDWSVWSGPCSQSCGGCGSITRKRMCNKQDCYDTEKEKCNFDPCEGQAVLLNNNEFFLLSNGCCLGLFRNDNKCGGLQNAFTTFISGLFPSLKEIAG